MKTLQQVYVLNDFNECAKPIMKIDTDYLLEYGIHNIMNFKKEYPESELLLDVKLCDSNFHVIERFDLNNIDFITMQGTIHSETILYVLKKAHETHMKVVVDLSGVEDLNDALEDMMIYGVDYVSIDSDDFIKLPN